MTEKRELKDIKWANKEIKKVRDLLNNKRYEEEVDDFTRGVLSGLSKALSILDQLDEPETLSQKWIDGKKLGIRNRIPFHMDVEYAVPEEDLQNLLVPKQEDMFNGEEPDEGEVYFAIGLEGAVEVNSAKSIDEAIERLTEHETNYSISRKPVIPKFVAEYIDFAKRNTLLIRVMELASTRNELPKWKKEYDWISKNHETFARAWLDGYTVEEEQLFYAKVKGWGTNGNDGLVYYSGKFPLSLTIPTESVVHTKDEWRNYGVYEGNAEFVLVEQLEE